MSASRSAIADVRRRTSSSITRGACGPARGSGPRGGCGQRLRPHRPRARAHGGDARGAPPARGALRGQSLAPLALGVRGGGVGVLGGALEERLGAGAHRLVAAARVLRPHLGDARPELARLQRLRAHERRKPRRLGGDSATSATPNGAEAGSPPRPPRRLPGPPRPPASPTTQPPPSACHPSCAPAGGAGVAARGRRDRRRRPRTPRAPPRASAPT